MYQDYFQDNHWDKLPKIWQASLENLSQTDVPQILGASSSLNHVFPLTLLCLRSLSVKIRSARTMAAESNLPFRFGDKEEDSKLALSFSSENGLPGKPLKTSDHILCRRIKLKKRHGNLVK